LTEERENPMPSFTIDIYKDWTNEQLRTRCRELSRAVSRYELTIAMMAEYGPEMLDKLPAEFRDRAKQLNEAYRDEDAPKYYQPS
jgi:hypothetical protein